MLGSTRWTAIMAMTTMLLALTTTPVTAIPKKQPALGTSHNNSPAAYVPTCNTKENFLVFDPPFLHLNDRSFDVPITVRLAKKPSSKVHVFLDAVGLLFETSSLTFNPVNWKTPIPLHIMPTAEFYEAKTQDVQIVATVDAACEAYSGCKQTYSIKRYKSIGGTCVVSGDPHYTTFNGLKVDYMGSGVFYLVESDYLAIQAYQYPCAVVDTYPASCIGAVAIRYGDSAAILSLSNKGYDKMDLTKVGKPFLKRISEDLDDLTYSPKDKETSDKWEFKLHDGSTITIDVGSFNGVSWLDVNILLRPGYYGKLGGLCNGDKETIQKQLMCKGGKKVDWKKKEDVKEWAESWRVPKEWNMFDGKYQKGWKKWPMQKKYVPTKGCHATTYRTCEPKTTTTLTTVLTTSTVVTSTYVTSTSTTTYVPVTTTSTTVIPTTTSTYATYSQGTTSTTSVYTTTSTSTTTYTTTTSVPTIYTTTYTTTTVIPTTTKVTETYTTEYHESTTWPATYTTTTTKTSCTLPVYKPTEYDYGHASTTTTAVVATTLTTTALGTTLVITTTAAPVPTYTTVPKSPTYYYESDDDDDDDDYGYTVPCAAGSKGPSPDQVSMAEASCQKLLTIPGCDKLVKARFNGYLHSCVVDALTTGSWAFAESTRRNLASLCQSISGYVLVGSYGSPNVSLPTVPGTPPPAYAAPAYQVAYETRQSAGFGDTVRCINDCSGKGSCTATGCLCVSPWSGADCSVNRASLPAPSPAAYAPAAPGAPAKAGVAVLTPPVGAKQVMASDYSYDPAPAPEDTQPKTTSTTVATAAPTTGSTAAGNGAVAAGGNNNIVKNGAAAAAPAFAWALLAVGVAALAL
ncbi:hypothetical protein HDU96_000259 [Phlyctochytrium bullatum]|nr:hypothetical protein HDU96_000259 [Phlyctochytrium bullatum]